MALNIAAAAPLTLSAAALVVYLLPTARPTAPPAREVGYRHTWPVWQAEHRPRHRRTARHRPQPAATARPPARARALQLVEIPTVRHRLAPTWRQQLAWRPA